MATGISKTKWRGSLAEIQYPWKIQPNDLSITLDYKGKKTEREIISGERSDCKLFWTSDRKNSTPNLLFWGDNLHILRALLDDSNICGNVSLIYIDPPYSTNNIFQTRDQTDAYADLLKGSHYIEFIRERLIVMRDLLSSDGSIYVHLDANMAFEIKIIMDEIFGKNNFRNWITRKKCSTKNTTRKSYGNISDYILFYTKTENYKWNRPYDAWQENRIYEEYPYIDEKNGKRYKRVPIHAPGKRNGETGKKWKGMLPPEGKHWQLTPEKLDKLDVNNEIYWSSNGNPRRKIFFDENKGIPQQDIWLHYRDSINQNMRVTGYPTEKNLQMLENIVNASSDEGDIVLDAFCGSGTTMQAAHNMNRRWIGIDNQENAIGSVLKRFHIGVDVMGDFVKNKKDTALLPHQLIDKNYFTQSLFESCKFELMVDKSYWKSACEYFKITS
ncbi:MAG: site-specific DNA-methyltransferase [Planctomycetaceae bacterium]|jgi:adenine-specific DNA-methyltransferase|nr:site-specific DNA-methyltransferase [Planctomycetaceae bacterium]